MKTVKFYQTPNGKVPFKEWMDDIIDRPLKRKIFTRIDLLAEGFMPDIDHVGGGVFETRIHTKGGIRIYFYMHKNILILLLCGGIKKTQKRDIQKAIEYADDFRRSYGE